MEREKLIKKAMSELGKSRSKKKADAARKNGRLGGRPRKKKDSEKEEDAS